MKNEQKPDDASANSVNPQKERLEYVDIFRGIALLIMVFIQIFDYLSVSNIYSTPPYYIALINSVTWVPPSLLFTFVSGMSVFLLAGKRLFSGVGSKKNVFLDILKRYGKYILISLPFTAIMWNIGIYIGWEEAIQGIGLAAVFTALFLIIFSGHGLKRISTKGYYLMAVLIILFAFLQSSLPKIIDNSAFFSAFPRSPGFGRDNIFVFIGSIILNAFFRGWFSVVNLFPIMLGGVIFISLIKKNISYKKLLCLSAAPLIISILLHISGYKINYYDRSFSFTFFAIGQSALICLAAYYLYNKFKTGYASLLLSKIWKILKIFGTTAFFVYIAHYLLILKMLQITGLNDLLADSYALIITIPLVAVVYLLAGYYLKIRARLPDLLRL